SLKEGGQLSFDEALFRSASRGLRATVPTRGPTGGYVERWAYVEKVLAPRSRVRCSFWVFVTEPAASKAYGIDFFEIIASTPTISSYELRFGIHAEMSVAGFREDVYFADGSSDAPRGKHAVVGGGLVGWTRVL